MGNFTLVEGGLSFGNRGPKPKRDSATDYAFWDRWQMEAVAPESFLELTDPNLLLEARVCSRGFMAEEGGGIVLEAWPYQTERPSRHWYHVDPDLIVHRYDYNYLPLLVYESDAYNMVRIALDVGPRETWPATIDRLIRAFFTHPFPVHWFPIVRSDEQARFASNAGYTQLESGNLNPYGFGVVGGIVDGGVYFMWAKYDSGHGWQKSGPMPLLSEPLLTYWNAHHP